MSDGWQAAGNAWEAQGEGTSKRNLLRHHHASTTFRRVPPGVARTRGRGAAAHPAQAVCPRSKAYMAGRRGRPARTATGRRE
jgi:hypothetical protein